MDDRADATARGAVIDRALDDRSRASRMTTDHALAPRRTRGVSIVSRAARRDDAAKKMRSIARIQVV